MKAIEVPTGAKGEPFVWVLVEQDLRVSPHWSHRGYFTSKEAAKAAGDALLADTNIWSASITPWRQYTAGLTDVDEIRWWGCAHSRIWPADVLAGKAATEKRYSGIDWNDSAYTQLVEKAWITEGKS